MTEQSLRAPLSFDDSIARSLSRRGKALLEANDLAARVEALEPLEAYFIVKELGVSDALPILKCASAAQLQAFVDLDCWQGDMPDPRELDAWLSTFANEGREALARTFLSLDPELQVLYLAGSVQVYEANSPEVPEQRDDVPRMVTSDTYFELDAIDVEARELHPFALIEALYAADNEEAYRLLMAVRWELASTLEEMALHFRNGRVEEMGFPPIDAAREIFAPPLPPHATLAVTPPPATLPALYAQQLGEATLLTRALRLVSDPALVTKLESDLVYLINAAIVAYGESPRDVLHLTEIAARVRDTVSLGLEVVLEREANLPVGTAEAALDRAPTLLERESVRNLFKLGHQEAVKLQREAKALLADPVVSQWLNTPDTERDDYSQTRHDRELLKALTEARPLYGGFDPLRPERRKAFGSRLELGAAEERLDGIAKRLI